MVVLKGKGTRRSIYTMAKSLYNIYIHCVNRKTHITIYGISV